MVSQKNECTGNCVLHGMMMPITEQAIIKVHTHFPDETDIHVPQCKVERRIMKR